MLLILIAAATLIKAFGAPTQTIYLQKKHILPETQKIVVDKGMEKVLPQLNGIIRTPKLDSSVVKISSKLYEAVSPIIIYLIQSAQGIVPQQGILPKQTVTKTVKKPTDVLANDPWNGEGTSECSVCLELFLVERESCSKFYANVGL